MGEFGARFSSRWSGLFFCATPHLLLPSCIWKHPGMLQYLCQGHAPNPSNSRLVFHLQFEGRKYCEHDFQMLFAPCCHQCGKFYVEAKCFPLITNGKSAYCWGKMCNPSVSPLGGGPTHLNFQHELGFREPGELLFLQVINQ